MESLKIRETKIAKIDIGRNLDLPGPGVRWNTNSKCMFPGIGAIVPSHSPVADKANTANFKFLSVFP